MIYRASQRQNVSNSRNHFYDRNSINLEASLFASPDSITAINPNFYVFRRLSSRRVRQREKKYQQLPEELRVSLNNSSLINNYIGSFEIDLIEFLLNDKGNQVLVLTANVGVGKTTFLKFMFDVLPKDIPFLRRYHPIFINGLSVRNENVTYEDIYRAALFSISGSDEGELFLKKYEEKISHTEQTSDFLHKLNYLLKYFKKYRFDNSGDNQIVIIFDNIDQMDEQSVERINSLARKINQNIKCPTIVSMRNTTTNTQRTLYGEDAIFYRSKIELTPPDLRAVLVQRINNIESNQYSHLDPIYDNGTKIYPENDLVAMRNILEKVLNQKNQIEIFYGLSNQNVRKAINCFHNFIKSNNLDYRLIFPTTKDKGDYQWASRRWTNRIINGIMKGENYSYSSERNQLVDNVLFFDSELSGVIYSLKYKTLNYLYENNSSYAVDDICFSISEYGVDFLIIRDAIKQLIDASLVESTDGEQTISHTTKIKISNSGAFYIEKMLTGQYSEQYIMNAICDVPLEHFEFQKGSYHPLICSLVSLIEYRDKLFDEECEHFNAFANRISRSESNFCTLNSNLLSAHISKVIIRRLNAFAKRSNKFYNFYAENIKQCLKADDLISNFNKKIISFMENEIINRKINSKADIVTYKPKKSITVRYPKIIGDLDGNHIDLIIDKDFVDENFSNIGMFAHVACYSEDQEVWRNVGVFRANSQDKYSCRLSIPHSIIYHCYFSNLSVSIFAGVDCILTRNLSATKAHV